MRARFPGDTLDRGAGMKDWLDRIFGGPATSDAHRLVELDEFCGPDATTLERLAEVFENAATLLKPYADGSVSQAFWDLNSNVFFALSDESIEWVIRLRVIQSFEPLFRGLFAVRCQSTLGHLDKEGDSPLNTACYMWFDMGCWYSSPVPLARNRLDFAFLDSMRSILAIDHDACRESALHGLGHWHQDHAESVENIIDEFLRREPHLQNELREYAQSARIGYVL